MARRENARQLKELIHLIWQQLYGERQEIYGATISSQGCNTAPEYEISLNYQKPLDQKFSSLPILYADATQDETLAKLPFAEWSPRFTGEGEEYWRLVSLLERKDYSAVEIRGAKPHMTAVKIVDAPTSKGELTKNIQEGKRFERDATIERMARLARCISERCGPYDDDRPSAGVIGNMAVAEYMCDHHTQPPWVKTGHYNAVTGSNEFESAKVILVIGQTRPQPQVFAQETEGVYALAPDQPTLTMTDDPIRNVQGAVEVINGESRATPALGCPDPLANKRLTQTYATPVMQAADRGRGLHASAERPLLMFDCSRAPLEEQYSAAIHWHAFANISELDVMAYGAGLFIPHKPSWWVKAFPGLFADKVRAENYSARLLAEHANKYGNAVIHLNKYITNKSMTAKQHFLSEPPIIADLRFQHYILWGKINHALLQPRTLHPVLLHTKNASIPAYIDPSEWNDPKKLSERLGRRITRIESLGSLQSKRPRGRPRKGS